jgi:alpha-beta hydrolase superfamily lysophospholipase
MRPFFFGEAGRQLLGAHHPAREETTRSMCVVLAYPWLAEYNACHPAFRKLAGMLASAGFSTLRFDYRGMGDSAGVPSDNFCADWAEDIVSAAQELSALSSARSVCVVGLGLGAALAVKAATLAPLDMLVLWEPVQSGEMYLRQLEQLDRRHRLARLYPAAEDQAPELLGFPFSEAARRHLAQLDLMQHTLPRTTKVNIVAPEHWASLQALTAKFSSAPLELTKEGADLTGQSAMLSMEPLRAIVRLLERAEAA